MDSNEASIGLMRAIGQQACPDDETASTVLAYCNRLGIDPLAHAVLRFGLTADLVWQRAAQWGGFAFARRTPAPDEPVPPGDATIPDMEVVRDERWAGGGADVGFWAPDFDQMLLLAAERQAHPEIARTIRIVPPHVLDRWETALLETRLTQAARDRMSAIWPRSSARNLPLGARLAFALGLLATIGLVLAAGMVLRPVLIPISALLLAGPGLLRMAAAFPCPADPPPPLLGDAELPIYSVLIPLRDEAEMVAQLREAMCALDYPPEKLDIRFAVETRSAATLAAVETLLDDPRFRLIAVADSVPRTKPKALDFALPQMRGEFLVVFDAEDVPAPDQLRKAASRFAADPEVMCLQAALVPENAHENLLTALFAGEYAGLFGRLLPALARWNLALPLGGTSNHFRMTTLRELGGWDAFNVTEDADLGIRLRRRGHRVEMLDSVTLEEAPVSLRAFLAQRTRWMKGWMQTFIVHNADPVGLWRDLGPRAFIGFEVLVGGMILSALLHTAFMLSLLLALLSGGRWRPPDIWDGVTLAVLVCGYGGAISVTISGLVHIRAFRLLPCAALLPLYWLLHTWAALRAIRQLVMRPFYWAKTTHGLTRMARGGPDMRPPDQ